MDCPQVLQTKLLHRKKASNQERRTTSLTHLCKDEDNGVVPVPPAWMDLEMDVSREGENVWLLAVHTTARPASSRLR